jgi:hypothetical protein
MKDIMGRGEPNSGEVECGEVECGEWRGDSRDGNNES